MFHAAFAGTRARKRQTSKSALGWKLLEVFDAKSWTPRSKSIQIIIRFGAHNNSMCLYKVGIYCWTHLIVTQSNGEPREARTERATVWRCLWFLHFQQIFNWTWRDRWLHLKMSPRLQHKSQIFAINWSGAHNTCLAPFQLINLVFFFVQLFSAVAFVVFSCCRNWFYGRLQECDWILEK